MPKAKVEPQTGFDQEVIQDHQLEDALTKWEAKHSQVKALNAQVKPLHEKALGLIQAKELTPGEYRCGPFMIKVENRPSAHREFDVPAKEGQITFRLPKGE